MGSENKCLLNKYTLRSKDIPLVKFSLYKTDNIDFGIAAASYDIEITHIYNENKNYFLKISTKMLTAVSCLSGYREGKLRRTGILSIRFYRSLKKTAIL